MRSSVGISKGRIRAWRDLAACVAIALISALVCTMVFSYADGTGKEPGEATNIAIGITGETARDGAAENPGKPTTDDAAENPDKPTTDGAADAATAAEIAAALADSSIDTIILTSDAYYLASVGALTVDRDITIKSSRYTGSYIYSYGADRHILFAKPGLTLRFEIGGGGLLGGGIYTNSGAVTIRGKEITIDANSGAGGSAICCGGDLNITDGTTAAADADNITISGNDLSQALYAAEKNVTVSGCTFEDNIAGGTSGFGGAICYTGKSDNKITVSDSAFKGNKAGYQSGALHIGGAGDAVIDTCAFTGNRSDDWYGAARFVEVASIKVTDSVFTGNTAPNVGAIGTDRAVGVFTIKDSKFTDNESDNTAGAVHVGGLTGFDMEGCEFTGNRAARGGGVSFEDDVGGAVDGGGMPKYPTKPETWPLLNLIFMIVGAALGVLAAVIRGRRDGRDDEDREPADWDEKRYGAWSADETPCDEYGHTDDEEYPPDIYRTALKIVTVCVAATGVIVWCVTQHIAGRMVLTDGYTFLQGLLTVAVAVVFMLSNRRRKEPGKYEYKLK